jgi:hypothetical protein
MGSSPLPVIASRLRPGRSGNAVAHINLQLLPQPALRRRGTEVTCPKPSACTSACCLTLRSAATPHGKPLGRRGTLAYAAPRRPSALPRGSRLAQTLGLANQMQKRSHLHAPAPNQSSEDPGGEASQPSKRLAKRYASYFMLGAQFCARKSGQEAAITNSRKPPRHIIFVESQRDAVARDSTLPGSAPTAQERRAQVLNHQRCTPPASRILLAAAVATRARPNPSLSPRPTTAGRLARAARWFMLHRTGKPSCLRGRG